jgi:hypothetical protein
MKAFTLQEILITMMTFSLLLGSFWSLIQILSKSDHARRIQNSYAEKSNFWNLRLAGDFSNSESIRLNGNSIQLKRGDLPQLIYAWSNDYLLRLAPSKNDTLFGKLQRVCTWVKAPNLVGALEICISPVDSNECILAANKYYSAEELMRAWNLPK